MKGLKLLVVLLLALTPVWAYAATFGTMVVHTSLTCGDTTMYAAPMYHACHATEGTADYTLPSALSVTGIVCHQRTEAVCTTKFTLRQNTATVGGGTPTFQCTDTDRAGCSDITGTPASYAANDEIDIMVEDVGATCDNGVDEIQCAISYTVP